MADENPYAPPQADLTVPEPGTAIGTRPLAGLGLRFVAAIIDAVISLALSVPAIVLLGFWEDAMFGGLTFGELLLIALIGVGIFLAAHGYLLAKHGQTVGKRLIGTRIVSVDNHRILPFGRVIATRYLPLWVISQVPILGPLFSFVDVLFIFRGDRRCIHDHIAGTKVVLA